MPSCIETLSLENNKQYISVNSEDPVSFFSF